MPSRPVCWMKPSSMAIVLKALKEADLVNDVARQLDRASAGMKLDLRTGDPLLRMSMKTYKTLENISKSNQQLIADDRLIRIFDCNPQDPYDPCHQRDLI